MIWPLVEYGFEDALRWVLMLVKLRSLEGPLKFTLSANYSQVHAASVLLIAQRYVNQVSKCYGFLLWHL